jgi:hypothetical protein
MLRMSGATPLLPLYAFIARTGTFSPLHSRSTSISDVARCNINTRIVFCSSNSGVFFSKVFGVWMCDGPIPLLGNPLKCLQRIFMNPEQLKTLDYLCIYRHLDRQTDRRNKEYKHIMKLLIMQFSSLLLLLSL